MKTKVSEQAELFAAQWCIKNEDYRIARLAFKAGYCQSQKDIKTCYITNIFKKIWMCWHKAKYDSLEELYLCVFLTEQAAEIERITKQQKIADAIKSYAAKEEK